MSNKRKRDEFEEGSTDTLEQQSPNKVACLSDEDINRIAKVTVSLLESTEQRSAEIKAKSTKYDPPKFNIQSMFFSLFGFHRNAEDEREEQLKFILSDIVLEKYSVRDLQPQEGSGDYARLYEFSLCYPRQVDYGRLLSLSNVQSVVSVQLHQGPKPGILLIQVHATRNREIASVYFQRELENSISISSNEKSTSVIDDKTKTLTKVISSYVSFDEDQEGYPMRKNYKGGRESKQIFTFTKSVKTPMSFGQIRKLMSHQLIDDVNFKPHERLPKCLMVFDIFAPHNGTIII